MNKTLKVLLIITLFVALVFSATTIFATESEPVATSEEVISDETTDQSMLSSLSPSTITSVSTMNNYSQANLELNNVLSIILISIGVLIILLAISILIKLKK